MSTVPQSTNARNAVWTKSPKATSVTAVSVRPMPRRLKVAKGAGRKLAHADFVALAKKSPPPQAWYDETNQTPQPLC